MKGAQSWEKLGSTRQPVPPRCARRLSSASKWLLMRSKRCAASRGACRAVIAPLARRRRVLRIHGVMSCKAFFQAKATENDPNTGQEGPKARPFPEFRWHFDAFGSEKEAPSDFASSASSCRCSFRAVGALPSSPATWRVSLASFSRRPKEMDSCN